MASLKTKNSPESYIGSFIIVISKYEIRYEGVLYHLNVHDSTIGLKDVKSYGTEGRKKDGPQVPPSDKVYEYILFRGSDIKDLEVKSSPLPQKDEQIYKDPAIIQSQSAGVLMNTPPSLALGSKTLTESSSWQDTPALTSRASTGALPLYQPAAQVGPLNQPQATQSAGTPSFSMPMYWQGYNETSPNIFRPPKHAIPFQSPSVVSAPMTMQSLIQPSELHGSPTSRLITTSGFVVHGQSPIASNHLHPNFSFSPAPLQSSTTAMPLSLSHKASFPSAAAYMNANDPTTSLVPSSCQDTRTTKAQIAGKAVSDPVVAHPPQSMHYPASSFVDSASGPMLTPSPSLLTPDQLAPSTPHVLSSTQAISPDKKDTGVVLPASSHSPPALSAQVTQPPLLPLPTSASQLRHPTSKFTEEFDFEAMNEKFKKDEVWGYFGKAKQRDNTENAEDNVSDLGNKEACEPSWLAYKKDDFFDTISCNSLNHGTRDGQNRFSERMKLDTETFGNFRQRAGYSGYGAGRGGYNRGLYNGGRGYSYGGRGHVGNMHN